MQEGLGEGETGVISRWGLQIGGRGDWLSCGEEVIGIGEGGGGLKGVRGVGTQVLKMNSHVKDTKYLNRFFFKVNLRISRFLSLEQLFK